MRVSNTWLLRQTYLQFCDSVCKFLDVNSCTFVTEEKINSLIPCVRKILRSERRRIYLKSRVKFATQNFPVLHLMYLAPTGFAPVIVCPWRSCICNSWTYDIHQKTISCRKLNYSSFWKLSKQHSVLYLNSQLANHKPSTILISCDIKTALTW